MLLGGACGPQELSNALWALDKLGVYEAGVYSYFVGGMVGKGMACAPQALSIALLACAEAQHWDSITEGLAALVSKQGEGGCAGWREQELANSLYSWAVLSATTAAAAASPGLRTMAGGLFREVEQRVGSKGGSCFLGIHYVQMFQASVRRGRPSCLVCAPPLRGGPLLLGPAPGPLLRLWGWAPHDTCAARW